MFFTPISFLTTSVMLNNLSCSLHPYPFLLIEGGGRRHRDRMVVGFTATCAISDYHH